MPRELEANLLHRLAVLIRCEQDAAYRQTVLDMCRQDCLYFISTFVVTYNPREHGAGKVLPFIAWDFQDEAVRAILDSIQCHCNADPEVHQHDLLIEKSREMGASWLCLIVMTWLWLFHPWQKFLCISRNEEAVDKPGEPDSLFWKIDFILERLPVFLLQGYNSRRAPAPERHRGHRERQPEREEAHRRKRSFSHPNGSTITGQASTGKAGVGGRATAMFIDEFSQIDEGYEVLSRTSDTTGCRIFNSTHKRGLGGAFYDLTQRVDMKKIVLHWTQHPHKNRGMYYFDQIKQHIVPLDPTYQYPPEYQFVTDGRPTGGPRPGIRSPWYDKECPRKANDRGVAEDLDINPSGAVSQVFSALLIRDLLAHTREPDWVGTLEYDPDFAEPKRLVEMPDGLIRLWLKPDHKGRLPVDHYVLGNDLSRGVGATPSCCTIFRPSTGEKVGEIVTAAKEPDPFARLVTALARHLVNEDGEGAYLVWEGNGPGDTFGDVVTKTLGYLRCQKRKSELQFIISESREFGWAPTPRNKDLLLDQYHVALRERAFGNYSEWALKECLSYKVDATGHYSHAKERSDNDPSGARVNHGDRVIADALAWLGARHYPRATPDKPAEGLKVLSRAWRDQLVEKGRQKSESWI